MARTSVNRIQGQRLQTIVWRVLLGLLALAAGLATLGASYEALATAGDATRYPPPGQLIDVGGHQLHLFCNGEGEPTVVLVTGLGAAQEAQRQLSTNSRLVAVAQRSHHLALDQPQAVANAVQQVVTAARTGRPLEP